MKTISIKIGGVAHDCDRESLLAYECVSVNGIETTSVLLAGFADWQPVDGRGMAIDISRLSELSENFDHERDQT